MTLVEISDRLYKKWNAIVFILPQWIPSQRFKDKHWDLSPSTEPRTWNLQDVSRIQRIMSL